MERKVRGIDMDEIIKAIYDSVNTESVPVREIVIPEHGHGHLYQSVNYCVIQAFV